MTGTKANLKDSEVIVEFQHALGFFSGSVERLMDAVSDYLNDVRREMERHIALLEKALEAAKEKEERANEEKDAAYDEWQRVKETRMSASYSSDEEDGGAYEQLYGMEREAENRYYRAKEAYEQCVAAVRRAKNNLDEGKAILDSFRYCEDEYRAPYSPLTNPGGDAFMRHMAEDDVRESITYLERILEVVWGYCSCPMSLDSGGNVSPKPDLYRRPDKREMELRREKAMDDAGYRMRRERSGSMPNPDTQVRCKICGRPFAICRCRPSILPDVNK